MNLDDQKFLRTLGSTIRELRDARGLTQAQLGEACSLHRTFIGSVERGERNVAVLNLRRIAKTLRVPLSDLFSWEP
jgi:transcriptional regulator with XRE-family HTH domain